MKISYIIYKSFRRCYYFIYIQTAYIITRFLFSIHSVKISKGLQTSGIPVVNVHHNSSFYIGLNFRLNNNYAGNLIGRQQPCIFIVKPQAKLEIGNNVGMSSTAIICWNQISIGNNVRIGGNTVIYDTDFHSLDPIDRTNSNEDLSKVSTSPVCIGDNVFIGAHVTILKGVMIGENSIIGACSVVTKSIPPNEIWGGNPAKLIRKVIV